MSAAEIVTDKINASFPGHLACEYINTGTLAAPVYLKINRIEDVDHPDERATSEVANKGSDFVGTLRGKRKRTVAFVYQVKRGNDPVLTALEAAYTDVNKCVHYWASDRPITEPGAKGFHGPYVVTKFGEKRPFADKVGIEVELAMADADLTNGDKWETVPFVIAGP